MVKTSRKTHSIYSRGKWNLVLEFLANGDAEDVVAATKFVNDTVNRDLLTMVADLRNDFPGQIAVITGVTINTAEGNFFAESENTVY